MSLVPYCQHDRARRGQGMVGLCSRTDGSLPLHPSSSALCVGGRVWFAIRGGEAACPCVAAAQEHCAPALGMPNARGSCIPARVEAPRDTRLSVTSDTRHYQKLAVFVYITGGQSHAKNVVTATSLNLPGCICYCYQTSDKERKRRQRSVTCLRSD